MAWTYKVLDDVDFSQGYDSAAFITALDAEGALGWELAFVIPINRSSSGTSAALCRLIFKQGP